MNKDIFITANSIIHGMLIDIDKLEGFQEVFVNINSVLSILLRDDMEERLRTATPTEVKMFKKDIAMKLLDWFTMIVKNGKRVKIVYQLEPIPEAVADKIVAGWYDKERQRMRVDSNGKFVNMRSVSFYYNIMKVILNLKTYSSANIDTIPVLGISSHIVMHMNIIPGVKTLVISRDHIDYVLVSDNVSFVTPSGRNIMDPQGVCDVVKCKASPLNLGRFFMIAGVKNRYKGKRGYAAGKTSKYLSDPSVLVELLHNKEANIDMFNPTAMRLIVDYNSPTNMLVWNNIIRSAITVDWDKEFVSKLQ